MTVRLSEWERMTPAPGAPTHGLVLRDGRERALAEQLTKLGRMTVRELRAGLEIEATSWVGRVDLGGVGVSVTPKLAPETLLALFAYAYGLDDLKLHETSGFAGGSLVLADLLVAQLDHEARALLRGGLARRYEVRREWLGAPRGRVRFDALARGPLTRAELPCAHHVRQVDWKLNQRVLAGVDRALAVVSSAALRARVAATARAWKLDVTPAPGISATEIRTALLALDRQTERYRRALVLIEMIVEGATLGLDAQDEATPLPGFLFDMNRFFQALLTRFLREHLDEGSEVRAEVRLHGLMRYATEHNPRGRRAPVPRADLEVRRGRSSGLYLDAKYRDLWDKTLPREMLYQLALYALASSHGKATILYPTEAASAREARIELRGDDARPRIVGLRPVVLPRMREVIDRRDRDGARALARYLVYGDEVRGVSAGAR